MTLRAEDKSGQPIYSQCKSARLAWSVRRSASGTRYRGGSDYPCRARQVDQDATECRVAYRQAVPGENCQTRVGRGVKSEARSSSRSRKRAAGWTNRAEALGASNGGATATDSRRNKDFNILTYGEIRRQPTCIMHHNKS